MFAFELGWSADIPATLNTGSPSFGASLGLPVSKTSWHCCGSQNSPALRPQNKASGAQRRASEAGRLRHPPRLSRKSSLSAAHSPAPCRASRRRGRLTAGWQVAPGRAGLRSRAQEVSLSLRQPVPRAVGAASPAAAGPLPRAAAPWAACQAAASVRRRRPRRPPRPQLSRSRHANFWLGTKGSARAGRGRALLPRAARRRSLEVLGWRAVLLPLPAPPRRAAPPGQPPWKPGSARRRAQGRRTEAEPRRGQGKGATRAEREGRRRGLEAEEPKEGLFRGSGRGSPSASLSAHQAQPTPSAPQGGRKSPAPKRERGGDRTTRESPPYRANPLTKESPALFPQARPPPPPRRPAAAHPAPARSPAQGRANPEGHPRLPQPAGFGKGHEGPHLPAGPRRVPCYRLQLCHQRLS